MRVVVIGHGMVGARFVAELVGARPASAPPWTVTVLAEEEYEPYNRVLLSEVVAGAVDLASLTLPAEPLPVTVLRGQAAVGIDRSTRTVRAADGSTHPYDHLVLATGARARVPAIPGLTTPSHGTAAPRPASGRGTPVDASPAQAAGVDAVPVLPDAPPPLPAGVHALRTLDDAREIVAATVNARRAVVLGGGVLGLEVACGLVRRGLAVTVVHGGPHPMDRQLDAAAAAAVDHGLRALGIMQRTRSTVSAVVAPGGRLRAVVLGAAGGAGPVGVGAGGAVRPVVSGVSGGSRVPDGLEGLAGSETIPADLLVLTAGTQPCSALAAAAGLAVDRGVLVDGSGTTADPVVHAIGDCAQPPEGATGLLAQGWDQARRLAERLTATASASAAVPSSAASAAVPGREASPRPAQHGTDAVRLKAEGLEVVTMGVCGSRRPAVPGARTVRLSDPDAGRHVEVVVADGVVVGATCVGSPAVGADLLTAYSRRTPAPTDPAQLLLRRVTGGASDAPEPSPTLMPDRATVCRCNGVTKGDVVAAWRGGARSTTDVARTTRATTGCGGCTDAVCGLVDWLTRSDPTPDPAPAPVDPPPSGRTGRQSPHPSPGPVSPSTTGRAGRPAPEQSAEPSTGSPQPAWAVLPRRR